MAEEFGPFELERLLGRGGMAEVFIARRKSAADPEPIVLKRIRPDLAYGDQEYIRRFVLEAQVASRISHPNLVRFQEFGQVGECRYIAMEQVTGYSLHRLLEHVFDTGQAPPLEVALHIGAGILQGISAMHGVRDDEGRPRPMLHRDITPKNVIVSVQGRPVVIDFGIAKDVLGPSITLPGKVIGTARYMAPEHRRAEYIDARADLFSVGVILFELACGKHPWKPLETLKELLRVTFDPPDIPAEIRARLPKDVEAVLLKSIECDPANRYGSASEMTGALESCASFIAIGDRGDRLTAEWIRSVGIPSDQELDNPVLDHKPKPTPSQPEIVWNPSGALSTGEEAFNALPAPEPPNARVLTIPPLPPTRDAVLDTGDVSIDVAVARSRPMWVIALVVIGVLVALLGGSVLLFGAHL